MARDGDHGRHVGVRYAPRVLPEAVLRVTSARNRTTEVLVEVILHGRSELVRILTRLLYDLDLHRRLHDNVARSLDPRAGSEGGGGGTRWTLVELLLERPARLNWPSRAHG